MTPSDLLAFEIGIAGEFDSGNIGAPIHLSGGNEKQLIEIFREVKPQDWVLSTWRSHYHALLKGIPPAEVKRQIMAGRSMFISSVEYRFMSSAIMGAMLPIACGLAFDGAKVWCFVGDMAASIGAFHDASKFVDGYGLDIRFVVEDNGLSTNTPTKNTWKHGEYNTGRITRYRYERIYPHYQPLQNQGGF